MLRGGLCALIVALCCVCAPAAPASQCDLQPDQQALDHIENQWINAAQMPPQERLRFFEQVLAPDGVHIVDSGQRYTHREILDYYRKHPQPPSTPRARFKAGSVNIRIYGAVAIVEGITVINGEQGGDQHEDRFTDIFEKRNGCWLAVNEQETRVAPPSQPVHH